MPPYLHFCLSSAQRVVDIIQQGSCEVRKLLHQVLCDLSTTVLHQQFGHLCMGTCHPSVK